ncbi:hypothetical protein [Methanothermobacter marburgensis]|uniref:hypothetical protein n=1 Tax=Methanothermobacter marburgensis TaxID=145263 RepID=UPI0035BAD898
MRRAYVLMAGVILLLFPWMLSRNSGFLLGLAFAIFTGLVIARFSKPAEEKTNMIISAVSCYTILVLLQALRSFPLNSWTLLFTAGSFFLSLILMQTGSILNSALPQ